MSALGNNASKQAPVKELMNLMHKKQPPSDGQKPPSSESVDFPSLGAAQQKQKSKMPNAKFDKKGGQSISIAVNHERKAALASSSNNLYETRAPKASDVYDAFVEAILRKGGYLNSVDVLNGLQDKIPDLEKMSRFRDLQNMNKQVHSAVTCYWNARSVRTYFELQEFVIDKLAGYKQMPKPKSFSEFGLGTLCKNEVVLKYLTLYDVRSESDLPKVSTGEVVQCMLDFLRENHSIFRVDAEGTAQAKFSAYLRKSLRTELTGVDVDFKSLFYSSQQSRRDWFRELTDCRTKYGKEYKEELCAALDSLVASQTKRTVAPGASISSKEASESHVSRLDDTFLRSVGVNSQQMLSQFQAIAKAVPELNACIAFTTLVPTIMLHRGINRKAGLSLGIGAIETVSGAWLNLTDSASAQAFVITGGSNYSRVMLASALPAKTKELLVSSVLGFVSYLISNRSATGVAEINLNEDADWAIRDWCRGHLLEDVPEVFLNHARSLLKSIIDPQQFIRIVAGSGGRGDRATLDWMQVRQAVESLLEGKVCDMVGPSRAAAAPGKKMTLKQIRAKVGGNKAVSAPAPAAAPAPPASAGEAPSLTVPTGGRALLVADYLAVLTIAIVYNRMLTTEQPSKLPHPASGSALLNSPGANTDTSSAARQVVCECVSRSVNDTLADPVQLTQLMAQSEESGPTAAIVSMFLTIESALLSEFSVPSFECARLGGSFLQFLTTQLSSSDATAVGHCAASGVLRDAVQKLHKLLSPSTAAEGISLDDNAVANDSDTAQNGPSIEALLATVSTHLSAVLSSREFEQDSRMEDTISLTGANSVASQVAQLLGEVEQRVQETEGFWTTASTGASASFLSIATALIEGDAEVAQRVQRLLALPQQSEEERTQVDSGMAGEDGVQAQVLVSVELAVQAVLQSAASGPGSSIFESLQHCKEHIAQVLAAAFRVPLEVALRQADRVFQQLKTQGAIHFDGSRGSVEIRTAQASAVGAVLTFATPSGVDADLNSSADALFSSAWTENMIELLLQTPLGTSCAELTLWQEQHGPEAPSIAEFILQHHAVLQSRRQSAEGVTFFVIPGADDCVPLPQDVPTAQVSDRLLQALHAKQYSLAAAFCMAAWMALIDATAVSSAVNAFFLQSYESFGADAMDRLSDLSLHLASALPRSCRSGHCAVLRLCVKALAAAGKINLDTAQHCVWQAALRTGSVGLHLLRLLVSVGMMAPADFSVFAQCAREWSVNSASIISRALAESEKRVQEAQNVEQTVIVHALLPDEPVTAANVSAVEESNADTGDLPGTDGELTPVASVSEQKAFILDLLQRQYHYTQGGLVRPAAESPEGRQLQQAMMLLSATLYSSQVHFVMELIQNADDNTYLPGVTPTIRLELFPHAVIVYNNEQGFSDKNITAICNVGGSTKANKTGYIGQKGIGFKSVFSISDVPEVHSNGYHIAFRREVSMLEPQWLDPTSESQWPAQYDSSGTYYETCLRLRLDAAALKNLAKLNQDIQGVFNGKLILFLNKLERMVLEDRMRNQVVEHCRTRLSDNWMRISIEASAASTPSSSSATSSSAASSLNEVFWLVLRHRFSPTVRRVEVVVAETEVAIAFKFIKTGRRFKSTKKLQPMESAADAALVRALAEEADLYNEVSTKKHHTGGDQRGELDTVAVEYEQIRLDFSEGLMPVYAYLPTSTCCFRFMVQGDFVLPTNRESILEQNEWNLGLLNQVPKVFVQAITEMSRWCEAEAQGQGQSLNKMVPSPTDFPVLSQLSGSAYRLLIEPADLLHALPRRREATRDYMEGVVSSIYQELRSVPCLQSRSGAMCAPSQLVAVHYLDFDPATFVSEELLLAATGCQYAMHDTGEYELDNDLVADLGVRFFDISCVVECLQHLSTQITTTRATSKDVVTPKQIASAVLGLDMLLRVAFQQKQNKEKDKSGSEVSPRTPTRNASVMTTTQRSLKPSQLITKSAPVATPTSTIAYTLEPAVRDILRQLCIWPTSTGNYVTLEHTLLFVQKRHRGAAFTAQQQECLNEFADRLHMIDAALLDAATTCTPQGADLLCNFLVDNFKQVRLSGARASSGATGKAGLGTELGALFSGGLEELTPDIVLKRVILPAYKRFAEQQSAALSVPADGHDSSETAEVTETEPSLDRRTAAAFLAFFYHSNWATKLNTANSEYAVFVRDVGVVVPVLTAREGNRGLMWTNKTHPALILVKKLDWDQILPEDALPQTEVHLCLELTDSPSSVLAALHTTTALRQLSWQVLDPLAACLMLGSGKVSLDQHKEAYTAAEVNAAFRGAQDSLKNWKEFLLRVGLVNFFGVYKTAPSQFKAPCLYRLLEHLLRNSLQISTSHQETAPNVDILPLFLPTAARDCGSLPPSVLRVTPDVHASLLKIAELISSEVLQLRQTKAASSVEQGSAFLADLDRRCWLPIAVHEKLLSGSSASATSHYVCAPRYVVSTHSEKSSSIVWYFGAHCAYLPYPLARNLGFRALFHFHEISSKEPPSAEFLMGYLAWLCKQAEAYIFSSVKFMRWFYQQVQSSLLSGEDPHASSLVQQQLTSLLQSDAALVWIPDQVQFSPPTAANNAGVVDPYINESFDACYAGKMFPLSRLVKRDPSEHLHFDASPVKSLALFYADSAVMQLFARSQYCKTCQAVEGMFGVRGGGHHTLSYPQLRCTCVHSKDSRMSALISMDKGVVRNSPGAVDLADTLYFFCKDMVGVIVEEEADGGAVTVAPKRLRLAQQQALESEQREARERADRLLNALSMNIWKCFQIKHSLHPYSSAQLKELRTHFLQHAMLPTTDSQKYVCALPDTASHSQQVALDDLEAFKLFEPELMALQSSVEWLQVFSDDTPEVDNVSEEDGGSSAYSMDALEVSEQHLLQLPAADFRAAVGTIPRQTFLAPRNKLALYEFLGIKKFSDHIQESWVQEPSVKQTKTGPAATLVGILNNLLAYAQAHYHHREHKKQHSPQLSQFDALQVFNMVAQLGSAGTRVHSLMQMEVVECHVLQRRVALALGEVRAENVLDATHYREFITSPTGTRSSTLYVSAQLSAAEVQSLAVSLLTKALRVEVALPEQRQDAVGLEELKRKLYMVANRATNAEILQTILDANDFGPLPPDLAPWKMEVVQYSELSDAPKSPWEMLAELSAEQRAVNQPNLDAYERMQHSSSAHRVNVAAQRRFLDTTNPVASAPPTLIVPAAQNCGSDSSAPLPAFRPPLPPGPPPPPPPDTPHAPRRSPQQEEVWNDSPGEARQRNSFTSTATAESGGAIVNPSSAESGKGHTLGTKTAHKTCTGKKRAWDDDTSPSPAIPAAGPASLSGTYVLTTPYIASHSASGKKQRGSNNNIPMSNPQVDIVFCEPDEGAQFKVTVPSAASLATAVDTSLADEIYSDLVSKGGATGVEAQSAAMNHTFVSGRLGEEVAVRHLRHRLLQQRSLGSTSVPCTAVNWLNEHTESGLPYDIELTFADGSVKHCEVKTRSVANYSTPNTPQSFLQQLQAPSQWLVTPAEVARAHQERQGYFCVFVSLRIDYTTHQVEELQTRIVGYVHGFMNAIRNKDAKLWVEVSDEHGTYS